MLLKLNFKKDLKIFLFVFSILSILMGLNLQAISHASSCCAESGGQSLCVLPSSQNSQFGLSTAYRSNKGRFDPYGEYTPTKDVNSSQTITTLFGAAYRVSEDSQVGLSLPLVSNFRRLSGKNYRATSFGDPTLEWRYNLWEDLSFLTYRPQLTLYGGVRIPLGKSFYNSSDPYLVDVVGDGTTTLHAGLNTSKIFQPIKFTLDGALFYPISKNVTKVQGVPISSPYFFKSGNRIQLIESAGYLINEHWSGTLSLKQLWNFNNKMNGEIIAGSAGRLFSTQTTLNYFYDTALGFGITYETAFPFYRYLANQPNIESVSIAAIYGGFLR